MLINQLEQKIKDVVKDLFDIDLSEVLVEHPNQETWGDFATNVALTLAKPLKTSPMQIADKIVYELENSPMSFETGGKTYSIFTEIYSVQPGFINFTLSKEWLYFLLHNIHSENTAFGHTTLGEGKTVLVEYSQPNSNKPQHIGHARNNFLGAAIANILVSQGYNVIKSNYVGDFGVHICKSMLMYQKFGEGRVPDKKADHFVGDFYIMFDQMVGNHPEYLEEAQELLRKLESGDAETVALWRKMNQWVYDGWSETYSKQGIYFDIWEFESQSVHVGREMAELAVEKGLAEKQADGSIIARLEKHGLPDKILLRSDGTSVYSTKDLQLALDGYKKYNFDQRLYVVDDRQADYFKQIFKILDLLGFAWASRLHHISYGFVKLPEGKMSSRKGIVANADDVLHQLLLVEDSEINYEAPDRVDVVHAVALSALKYGILKYDVSSLVIFDIQEMSRFVGNTGPYLLYARARAKSILEKGTLDFDEGLFEYEFEHLGAFTDSEMGLLRYLYRFPEVVAQAADAYAPNLICNYLFELSQRFNSFYNDQPILSLEDAALKNFRLLLSQAFVTVMSNGLYLLGIPAPDKM